MKIFETRNDLLDNLPRNLKIAELGVFRGDFAEEIFKRMNPKELSLVDIWCGSFGSGDKDGNNHTVVENMEEIFISLRMRYHKNDNVNVIRKNSIDFLNSYTDDYFDMIYVDADHSYNAVLNDLELSYKKIKNTGILSGHDYVKNTEIESAVNHFCKKYNQNIIALTNDGCPSFLIQLKK